MDKRHLYRQCASCVRTPCPVTDTDSPPHLHAIPQGCVHREPEPAPAEFYYVALTLALSVRVEGETATGIRKCPQEAINKALRRARACVAHLDSGAVVEADAVVNDRGEDVTP